MKKVLLIATLALGMFTAKAQNCGGPNESRYIKTVVYKRVLGYQLQSKIDELSRRYRVKVVAMTSPAAAYHTLVIELYYKQ